MHKSNDGANLESHHLVRKAVPLVLRSPRNRPTAPVNRYGDLWLLSAVGNLAGGVGDQAADSQPVVVLPARADGKSIAINLKISLCLAV